MITTTPRITIILDNQGVVQDMSIKTTSSKALNHKIEAIQLIKEIKSMAPRVKITSSWCPGHAGVQGNVEADRLANAAAKKPLPTKPRSLASERRSKPGWKEPPS